MEYNFKIKYYFFCPNNQYVKIFEGNNSIL